MSDELKAIQIAQRDAAELAVTKNLQQLGFAGAAPASEPAAQPVQDERAAFEKTINDTLFFPSEASFSRTKTPSGLGEYANSYLEARWVGWQAHALLAARQRNDRSPYIFGVKPSTWDAQIAAGQPVSDDKRDAGPKDRPEPWTDAERERFRAGLAKGDRCHVCSVILGGQHFPTCSQEGT